MTTMNTAHIAASIEYEATSRPGHLFAGNTQPLVDAILDWLASRHI